MKILSLTCDDLTNALKCRYGKGHYHAAAVYREIFRNGGKIVRHLEEFVRSQKLARNIENDLVLNPGAVVARQCKDGVTKFVTRLEDGHEIESVVIPMATRNTLCISSQVGCRMGCTFCETGKMRLIRNLTVEEIVGQVYNARFVLNADIKNVVFMGMGEPFDNFDAVIQAIRVMNDPRGLDIAHSHMTVSTAGRIDGIQRLGELNWPRLNLAVSLNASNDRLRSSIMPINRHVPMAQLKKSLMAYPLRPSGSFFIEYVLFKGLNDSCEHARELAQFLKDMPVRLNLIPYNPGSGTDYRSPSDRDVHQFADWLTAENIFVRKRWSRGRSIMAGCGQLGGAKGRRQKGAFDENTQS